MPQTIAIAAMAGSTIVSAVGAYNQGQNQEKEANYEAGQLSQEANQEQAVGQQKMIQQNKQTAYALSTLQARAAGEGGSATDPTVETIGNTIAGQGRFMALNDLYQGNAAAQSLNEQATGKRYSGKLDAQAGDINALTTILGGGSKMAMSYGNFTPGSVPDNTGGGSGSPAPWQMGLPSQPPSVVM